MPAIRDHSTISTRSCGHERAYSTALAKLKAALRDKMTGKLRASPSSIPTLRANAKQKDNSPEIPA